jgi:8-oxo-dGTP pyrophosphatase MutT (NUDIX family)
MLCNNCSKNGHVLHQCKLPIISCGIILLQQIKNIHYYLMIRRKDSFGYIDFIYGKYNPNNLHQVQQKIDEMSIEEKKRLLSLSFDDLWKELWGQPINNVSSIYKNEAFKSKKKFELLLNGINQNGKIITLKHLIENSNTSWIDTEWEFPKGRKNYQEKDLDCALREFQEETGYDKKYLQNINNILPFEEIFTGSNYKSYKHKYFIALMDYKDSEKNVSFEPTEVSKMEWKTYEDAVLSIRSYNLEKKQLIKSIHNMLSHYRLVNK